LNIFDAPWCTLMHINWRKDMWSNIKTTKSSVYYAYTLLCYLVKYVLNILSFKILHFYIQIRCVFQQEHQWILSEFHLFCLLILNKDEMTSLCYIVCWKIPQISTTALMYQCTLVQLTKFARRILQLYDKWNISLN